MSNTPQTSKPESLAVYLIPGLDQLQCKRTALGVTFLIVSFLGYILILPGLFFHVFSIIESLAYRKRQTRIMDIEMLEDDPNNKPIIITGKEIKNYTPDELKKFLLKMARQCKDPDISTHIWIFTEVQAIGQFVEDNEEIRGLFYSFNLSNLGLVVLTNKRLMIILKKFFLPYEMKSILLENIELIDTNIGFNGLPNTNLIKISTHGQDFILGSINKATISPFAELINRVIASNKSVNTYNSTTSEKDSYSKIEKLFEMKNKGILTEEEFELEKQKILSK